MRAVLQRVASASVTVDDNVVSQIGRGLMVLVGIGTEFGADDLESDATMLANKILNLRVFDANGAMWKSSVKDVDGDILCVSQFTLLANTSKGNKPDFHRAMGPEPARALYAFFLDRLRQAYKAEKIHDGKFGAMMNVTLTNQGPVTMTLDSRKFEYISSVLNNQAH